MRIVHIGVATHPPILSQYGGAIQRRIYEMAKEQVRSGHEVTIYSVGDRTEFRESEGVGIHYLRCATPLPLRQVEFQIRAIRHLRRSGGRPAELVHFHSQPEGGALGASLPGVKLLSYDNYYFRGGRDKPYSALYRRMLARFDRLMPCSEYCLAESAAYWQLPAERLSVLYNGVNTEQFAPDPEGGARERHALGIDRRVALYVGRVNEQKGSHVLLEAFAGLNRRRNDVQLVVAGPVGQFDRASDTATHWPDRVREVGGIYLGAVAEERLAAVYNMADVFVMPTVTLEMFGMAVVEAQACGIPVVASDHGGLRETVPEDCGGRFPVGDSAALGQAVERLLDDPEWHRGCAERALENARSYEWRRICERVEEIYASV